MKAVNPLYGSMMPLKTQTSKNTRGARYTITPALQQHLSYILPARLRPLPVPADIPEEFYAMVDETIYPLWKEANYKKEFLFLVKILKGAYLGANKTTIAKVKKELADNVFNLMDNPYFQALTLAKKQSTCTAENIIKIAREIMDIPRYNPKNLAIIPPFSLGQYSPTVFKQPLSFPETTTDHSLQETQQSYDSSCSTFQKKAHNLIDDIEADLITESSCDEDFQSFNINLRLPFFESREEMQMNNLGGSHLDHIETATRNNLEHLQNVSILIEDETTDVVINKTEPSAHQTRNIFHSNNPFFVNLAQTPCLKKLKQPFLKDLSINDEDSISPNTFYGTNI